MEKSWVYGYEKDTLNQSRKSKAPMTQSFHDEPQITYINKSLPKTGVDQPFLANRPYHNQTCPKSEPLSTDLNTHNKNIVIANLQDHLQTLIREELLVFDSYDKPKGVKKYIDEGKRVMSFGSSPETNTQFELNRFYS